MRHSLKFFFLGLILMGSNLLMAQPCPPGCVTSIIPIDGGIGFLVAAGAVLGYKKIRSRKS